FEEILAMRTGNYNKLAGYMSNHFGGYYSSKSLSKNHIFGSSGSSFGFDVKSSFGFGKFKFKKAKMPSTNFMKQAGSIGLDMIPVVGNIKSGLEAIMGRDLVTDQKLSKADRIIAAAGIFTGGAGKVALKGAKAGLGFAQGAKLTKGTGNSNTVFRAVTPEQAQTIKNGQGILKPSPAHKTTPTQHVAGTKHSRNPWTSTTKSQQTAEFYATHGGTRNDNPNPIVEIDLSKINPSNILDVSDINKASQHLKTPFTRNAAAKHKEVLIKGDIPAEAIKRFLP
ncbi:pre-toxin TG domain-containing protein, partial [Bacillus suaedaesalsae]